MPLKRPLNAQGRSGTVSVGSLVPGAHKVLFEPSEHLWQIWGFDSKHDFTPPTILLGLLLYPWTGGIFFWWDPTFLCRWLFTSEFSQEKMSTHPSTSPSLVCMSEATVRTRHGTTDGFHIGKGVRQGYILSPCLFNLFADYIMRNARLDEAQAGIKIAGRNQ